MRTTLKSEKVDGFFRSAMPFNHGNDFKHTYEDIELKQPLNQLAGWTGDLLRNALGISLKNLILKILSLKN